MRLVTAAVELFYFSISFLHVTTLASNAAKEDEWRTNICDRRAKLKLGNIRTDSANRRQATFET
jgi:hypothetical protein